MNRTCICLMIGLAPLSPTALAYTNHTPLDTGDLFTAAGITADRLSQKVVIQAKATGLDATSPIEFMLVSAHSGHDYESFAVTKAKPSHIHEALEFIGLNAGQAPDPSAFRFWPKGPRVSASLLVGAKKTYSYRPCALGPARGATPHPVALDLYRLATGARARESPHLRRRRVRSGQHPLPLQRADKRAGYARAYR